MLHQVDATNLAAASLGGGDSDDGKKFDYLIWNFPCVSSSTSTAADGQVQEIDDNKALLVGFFRNGVSFLREGGEIHVTHKTIEPFSWWGIEQLGRDAGLEFLGSVVFDRCLYPGYINRKVRDKKSFPAHDARTFIFASTSAAGQQTPPPPPPPPRAVGEQGLVLLGGDGAVLEALVSSALATIAAAAAAVGGNKKRKYR